jgi:hypothetical protein
MVINVPKTKPMSALPRTETAETRSVPGSPSCRTYRATGSTHSGI